jgi:hypothetical protein
VLPVAMRPGEDAAFDLVDLVVVTKAFRIPATAT